MRRYLTILILGMLVVASAASAADAAPRANRIAGDTLQQFTPAKHFIWTNKLWYTAGENMTLKWTASPEGDPYPYTIFVYLENLENGQRSYVAGNSLGATVRDAFGNAPGSFLPTVLPSVEGSVLLTAPAPAAGYYHFVAELRDISGTQVVKSAWAKFAVVVNEVVLGQDGTDTEISSDTTWTRNTVYRIRHQVFVNDGATLTIEPGTVVVAQGQNAVIVVEKGGRMVADGRKEMPIVMSCDAEIGNRVSGCWAGLIVLGDAPMNQEGGTGIAEGVIPATRPVYGGTNEEDDSGVYRFVRVEFAGVDFTNEIQPNAFGFHGVGRGTIIEHIQAHDGEDDGIEFFGGTANMKYGVSDGSKDDSLDWALGWNGKVQFAFILQDAIEADRGIEADNNENGFENLPRSDPKIWNATFVGSPIGNRGVNLRRGTAATLKNFIVMDFQDDGFEMSDDSTRAQATAGNTVVSNGIFWNNKSGAAGDAQIDSEARAFLATQPNISYDNPMLRNVRNEGNPDPRPKEGSPATFVGQGATPPSDGFLDTSASYSGAFGQTKNWLDEWTFFGPETDYAN